VRKGSGLEIGVKVTQSRRDTKRLVKKEAAIALLLLAMVLYAFYFLFRHQLGWPPVVILVMLIPTGTLSLTALAVKYWVRYERLHSGCDSYAPSIRERGKSLVVIGLQLFGYYVISVTAQAYGVAYLVARHNFPVGICLTIAGLAVLVASTRPLKRAAIILSHADNEDMGIRPGTPQLCCGFGGRKIMTNFEIVTAPIRGAFLLPCFRRLG
jgi:hypothetical protein